MNSRPTILAVSVILAALPVQVRAADCTWERTLTLGSRGEDVRALQVILNSSSDTQVASSGVGAPGAEGAIFGTKTRDAVKRFQEKYAAETLAPAGLAKGSGIVGALTRAHLVRLCTAATSSAAALPPATSPMLVIASGEQPAPTLAIAGAGGVPFTTFTLTAQGADVQVRRITLERAGAGVDQIFDGIAIEEDDGGYESDELLLDSNHRAIFAADITIPKGTTKSFTVYATIAGEITSYEGQMPLLNIVSVEADAPLEGLLPIRGTPHTVNTTLTIGGATALLSAYDPGASQSRYITDAGVRFSGIRITADSHEDLELNSITWDQAGTADARDIMNVATVVDGVAYATTIEGRWYTTEFPSPIRISKGNTVDVHIRGDIGTTGSNRTVKFDIRESGDIDLNGTTYGYGVGLAAAGNTAMSGGSVFTTSDGTTDGDEMMPFFSASETRITPGGFVSIGR